MKQIEKEFCKDSFLETIVNYGLIIRGNLEAIEEIKLYLAHHPDVDVIYQRYSFNKLYIRDDGDSDDESN